MTDAGATDVDSHDRSPMAKLRRIRRTAHMIGVADTARLLLHRISRIDRLHPDRVAGVAAFDSRHGLDTATAVQPEDLGIAGRSGEHAVEYAPTAVDSFHFMMDRIGIDPSRHTFVDIGAGKGLVLLLASALPFRQVIGVEASPTLVETARQNLERFARSGALTSPPEIHEQDALEFVLPDDDLVLYLCNPFGPVILEAFLDGLARSLEQHPRDIVLVYDNPDPANEVLRNHPILREIEAYETITDDYTWSYFENARHRRSEARPDAPSGVESEHPYLRGSKVTSEPSPSLRALVRAPRDEASLVELPVAHGRVVHTINGSAALHHAADVLGLTADDTVLCPAYNCGHEFEPFVARGIGVDTFAVDDDLHVDLADVRARITTKTKAILVVHYFGFPQLLDELRMLCDEHGLFLIEDCAHALWTDGVGSVGDVAIFSMRKTLPTPSGGALVINSDTLSTEVELVEPPRTVTWSKALDQHLDAARSRRARGHRLATVTLGLALPLVVVRKVLQRTSFGGANAWYDTDSDDFETDVAVHGWRMDRWSARIAAATEPDSVVARRRHNFERVLAAVDPAVARPIHTALPEGVCPWICAVECVDPERFSAVLFDLGVEAAPVWEPAHDAVDWGAHPRELDLKRRIVALPVHQDLDDAQLELVAAALHRDRHGYVEA